MAFWLMLSLFITIILIPVTALVLKITSKIFKLENTSYGTAFKISFIFGILGIATSLLIYFMPSFTSIIYILFAVASFVLGIWLIKSNYNIEAGKSILVLIVWEVVSFLISIILILAFVFIIGIIGLKIISGV